MREIILWALYQGWLLFFITIREVFFFFFNWRGLKQGRGWPYGPASPAWMLIVDESFIIFSLKWICHITRHALSENPPQWKYFFGPWTEAKTPALILRREFNKRGCGSWRNPLLFPRSSEFATLPNMHWVKTPQEGDPSYNDIRSFCGPALGHH